MKVNLKELIRKGAQTQFTIEITERLPPHIEICYPFTCHISVKDCDPYYLLTLHTQGEVCINCQRCLHQFNHPFSQETQMAVCASDEDMNQVSDECDAIVARFYEVNIANIITDDLYLFIPEKHPKEEDCDDIISGYIDPNNR